MLSKILIALGVAWLGLILAGSVALATLGVDVHWTGIHRPSGINELLALLAQCAFFLGWLVPLVLGFGRRRSIR